MFDIAILSAALTGVAVASVAIWSWNQVAQIHRRLGCADAFANMHFER